MNTRFHAVADAQGRPIRMFVTAGPVSDYTGAAAMLRSLPHAKWMLACRGYDADRHRGCVERQGAKGMHPRRKGGKKAIRHGKRRNRIVIIFGRLEDWRRIATT